MLNTQVEEADDDKRTEKKKQYEDKQVQLRVSQAVSNSKVRLPRIQLAMAFTNVDFFQVSTQTDLTLLLQFLHLYSLFSPSQSFAPPTMPPVVANATGQQQAAVHTLFNNVANGPLFGNDLGAGADSGDAISQIQKLQAGSETAIIEGVSFADIKQMILDLTAPPAEIGHEIPSTAEEETNIPFGSRFSNLPSAEEQPPLAAASPAIQPQEEESIPSAPANASGGGGSNLPGLNFMQASELGHNPAAGDRAQEAVLEDAPEHQIALGTVSGAATPGFGSGTPVLEKSEAIAAAPTGDGWNIPSLNTGSLPPAEVGWGDVRAVPDCRKH